MSRTLLAGIVAMAAAASAPARADLFVQPGPPPPAIYLEITVQNTTGEAVEFVRSSSVCVSESPEKFSVDAKARSTIKLTWTFSDAESPCYSDRHGIEYVDKASSKNRFAIQQFASSNDWACLGIEIFYGYVLDNAVCPEFHGNVLGPKTNPDPAKGLVYCPKDTPVCPPYDDGKVDPRAFGTEYWGFVIADPAEPALAEPDPALAIEYLHAGFGHYFVTASRDEIAALDDGAFSGWKRTGEYFKVYAPGTEGTVDVCRFLTSSFAAKSSHFHTSFAEECAAVKGDPNWQFEGTPFAVRPPDGDGNCAAGEQPLYRTYNVGQGGAPNHRYMAGASLRWVMTTQGWVPEGHGALGVMACVPI